MNRRKFLGLGIAAAALVPVTALHATDYIKEKPDTWKAEGTADAIKGLYGDIKPIEEGVRLKHQNLLKMVELFQYL